MAPLGPVFLGDFWWKCTALHFLGAAHANISMQRCFPLEHLDFTVHHGNCLDSVHGRIIFFASQFCGKVHWRYILWTKVIWTLQLQEVWRNWRKYITVLFFWGGGGVKVGLGFWSKSDHCFSENNVFVRCIPREIMHQHKYVDLWMKDLLDLWREENTMLGALHLAFLFLFFLWTLQSQTIRYWDTWPLHQEEVEKRNGKKIKSIPSRHRLVLVLLQNYNL